LLAVMTILFNLWLIPRYGLDGAAIASFSAFFIYNTIKLAYVRLKFGILPFTSETLKVILLLVVIGMSLYFLDFPFHPILNIAIKGLLITLIYVGVLYRFRISEDVFGVISRVFRRE
jgi:O-antigen/teichoic acid export membrane protein